MAEKKKMSPTFVSGPSIIGYYSVDEERSFIPDSSQLLYFNPPKEENVKLDLNEGIETAVNNNDAFEAEGIDHLLQWLKLNHMKLRADPTQGRRLQPNFICTRGILTRILRTPFASNDRWIIYATKLDGNIYLCGDKTKSLAFVTGDNYKKHASWGLKFEQCVLSASPDKASDTSKPVLESAEFRCVYECCIGDHSVLYSAVVKGECSEKILKDPLPLHKLKFIETATSRIIEHVGHKTTMCRYKFLNWWCQCYLTNASAILCGFKDQNGIVEKLKLYEVAEMIEMGERYWNPTECLNYCQLFLTNISETMANECNLSIWKFERNSNNGIDATKLASKSQYGFIPESFVEALA